MSSGANVTFVGLRQIFGGGVRFLVAPDFWWHQIFGGVRFLVASDFWWCVRFGKIAATLETEVLPTHQQPIRGEWLPNIFIQKCEIVEAR